MVRIGSQKHSDESGVGATLSGNDEPLPGIIAGPNCSNDQQGKCKQTKPLKVLSPQLEKGYSKAGKVREWIKWTDI